MKTLSFARTSSFFKHIKVLNLLEGISCNHDCSAFKKKKVNRGLCWNRERWVGWDLEVKSVWNLSTIQSIFNFHSSYIASSSVRLSKVISVRRKSTKLIIICIISIWQAKFWFTKNVADIRFLNVVIISHIIYVKVASYADALWARHAIFLPHERLLKRMGCLIRPITTHSAHFPIKAANFEPGSIFARVFAWPSNAFADF